MELDRPIRWVKMMATNWQEGDRIRNRWQIYKVLKGGMGIVLIVYDNELHELFAAKTFQDEIFARAPQTADRFTQEARTWINLDAHQNVTEALFVQKIGSKPYLFLEYVSGGDLGGWIGTRRLTEDLRQVLRFSIQFCDGMTHALTKGITAHRDIKPANCLVTSDRTLKVTDFGLAKVFDDDSVTDAEMPQGQGARLNVTRTGPGLGTLPYMAPERFADDKRVEVRADIYSFGVMLYEMITGRLPFVGWTWHEMERLHKSQPAPPFDCASEELSRIVLRCLAKEPEERYGDFGEVRKGLAAVYEQVTGEGAPEAVQGAALNAVQWNNKGASLNELGRSGEALAYFDRALELTPRYEPAWSNKGNALDGLGRSEEALACYDHALTLNPRFEPAWSNKGSTLDGLGRSQDALACYDHALKLNPHDEKAWYNKGKSLSRLEQYEEALACYEQALALNPRFEEAWYNKGNAFYRLERYEDAITCYEQALALNPHLKQAWYNKGNALYRLERYEDALTCYDRVIALDPSDEQVWFNKGVILARSFDDDRGALACFEEAKRLGMNEAVQAILMCRERLGSSCEID